MLYSIVLVSATHQHIWIWICMPPPPWTFLPPPFLSHPTRLSQSTLFSSLHHTEIPTMYFTHGNVYVSMLLSHFVLIVINNVEQTTKTLDSTSVTSYQHFFVNKHKYSTTHTYARKYTHVHTYVQIILEMKYTISIL